MAVVLHQFAMSHFNEKARWALAFKGVAHERETYLPGPHIPAIKKISGQTQTPVLQVGSDMVPGSAEIIDRLERDYPQPPLYPTDPEAREAALAVQREFDEHVGPAVRTVVFSALVEEGSYLCNMFGGMKSLPKRLAYRATFPLARPLIAKGNGVTPENVKTCIAATHAALDRTAEAVQETGYLVGDGFTVADLAAAALFAPIASLEHPDMRRPQPIPQRFQDVVGQFSGHATVEWVQAIYAKHRP